MAFAAGALAATVAILTGAALTLRVNSHPKPAVQAPPYVSDHGPARRVEVPVAGAVSVHLETWSADVRVRGASASVIRVVVRDDDAEPTVTRRADGRYDVLFGGGRLASGEVEVEVVAVVMAVVVAVGAAESRPASGGGFGAASSSPHPEMSTASSTDSRPAQGPGWQTGAISDSVTGHTPSILPEFSGSAGEKP
jgi:hypothetical protein